jgi:hypothetical protein
MKCPKCEGDLCVWYVTGSRERTPKLRMFCCDTEGCRWAASIVKFHNSKDYKVREALEILTSLCRHQRLKLESAVIYTGSTIKVEDIWWDENGK